MKQLLIFTLFTCTIAGLQAQTIPLRGKVSSAGTPAAYATVWLEGQSGTQTDSAGYFILQQAPAGRHVLRVSYLGFEPLRREVDLPVDTLMLLELASTAHQLDAVVITGTMKAVRKSESPVPVEIYSARFFQANPAPGLLESVQMINGLRPQMQCAVCNTGSIQINGMDGPYTLVLIDGMPIVSGLSSVYGLQGIPTSMISRLEVVKGPAASLYGSEAMGGLINVITKLPSEAPRLSFDVQAGSYGEYRADVSGKIRAGKATGLISGNLYRFQQRWDLNDDGFTDLPLQQRVALFNKWSWQRPGERTAALAVRYFDENRFGGQMHWTPAWRGTDSIYGESILTKRWEIIGAYHLPVKEKVLLQFSANRHWQDSYYGTTPYLGVQHVVFGQLTWDAEWFEGHSTLAGLTWRYNWLDDNTVVTAAPEGANQPNIINMPGAFVQDEWTIRAGLKLLGGLRYDWDLRHGHILSPRLNLKYNFDKDNTLRLSMGSGYRVANVFSEDHAALTGGRRVVFLETLAPERSWNVNANYVRFQHAGFGYVNIDASLFYTRYFNKIFADYLSDPELVLYKNLDGHARVAGVSLSTDWNFTRGLTINAGFTALDVAGVEQGERFRPIQIPSFTGNISVSWTLARPGLSIDYGASINGPMRMPLLENDYRPEYSPWFSLHNLQVTKKMRKNGLAIYAGVKNLFNYMPGIDPIMRPFDPFDKQVNDPVGNPNGYTFDPSYNYAPLQGTRIYAGVRCEW